MALETNRSSRIMLDYLPAIYQADPFLGQFLMAFEKVLLGRDDGVTLGYQDGELVSDDGQAELVYAGLEETIANLALLFDPHQTPQDFLSWLADWTAFTLRADLDVNQQRMFIAQIISLYRRRGTLENLQKLLQIFTRGLPAIIETASAEFQIGEHSTIGADTYIGGGPPFFFLVTISLGEVLKENPQALLRELEIARALIELEKPAHTYYELKPAFPSIQIGVTSTVGVDTLIGTLPE